MLKKVLILDCTGEDWTDRHLSMIPGVTVDSIYMKKNKLLRAIRWLCYKMKIFTGAYWYGKWKKDFLKYDVIIIFSCLLGNEIFSWIKEKGYSGRLIFYYRDPQAAPYLRKDCKAVYLQNNNISVDLWTFDSGDAKKFSMQYNPQFYFPISTNPNIPQYDAVYIGSLQGKFQQIKKIYTVLKTQELVVKFVVKREGNKKMNDDVDVHCIEKNIPYEEILKINSKAKAIVEINQSNQNGLTVRALEALFTNKKLITNNLDIKNMDFYNKNNIFIIGYDSMKLLKKFVNSNYETISEDIVKYYSAEKWLNRFTV